LAGLRGGGDVAFYQYGYCQVRDQGLDQGPGRSADAGGLSGVAVEGGGDGVGSGTLGSLGVFEGGDVGEDGTVELGVDEGDQFGPGFGGGEAASGAVQGDDVCSGVADGLGGEEVWGDVDVSVRVVGLDDADDGEWREGAEGGDARDAFGAETACSAAQDRGCNAGKGVEIVQRIAFGGLARDDETTAKAFEDGVEGGV